MPDVPVKILADYGERRSGLPNRLVGLGIDVEFAALPIGDFVVGGYAAIERKTVADLHNSIATGRLWRQIGPMRRAFAQCYLLVEGDDLSAGPIVVEGIRGALLAVCESGAILWARDVDESALWVRAIGVRARRSTWSVRRRQPRTRSQYALLRAIPGVTPGVAHSLLERFQSVAGVAGASESELLAVRGVGPVTAESLRRLLS